MFQAFRGLGFLGFQAFRGLGVLGFSLEMGGLHCNSAREGHLSHYDQVHSEDFC